ncbi:MAG: fatty acid cis/trans isomerase [Nitrosomonas sp.]|nr:fatty acid cis/trans isomerase [Nitrosomonas sp.]
MNGVVLKKYLALLFSCLLMGCDIAQESIPDRYMASNSEHGKLYQQQIRPLLDQRCVVCHGCYDAPCQLNLASAQGIDRGANSQPVYNGTRLTAASLTRLFEDAQSVGEWRKKGFYSVLNEKQDEQSWQNSLFYRILELDRLNPLSKVAGDNEVIPDELFDFSLNADHVCANIDQFDRYAQTHPYRGMPYGLPGLQPDEFQLLKHWLRAGSPLTELPELDASYQHQIHIWEAFLNNDTSKHQLVARYIYEHLFLGHLYFSELEDSKSAIKTYFKIVRSRTPPGQATSLISTRRPYDDPQVDRVYYRLQRVQNTITTKNHLPYALNQERLKRYKTLFFDKPYHVSELPGYEPETASNPFKTFAAIPAHSRYRFMLEHAHFTINGFIKGSVCRGQVALNVINDHFWVFFVNPDQEALDNIDQFLRTQSDRLDIPSKNESTVDILEHWPEYAKSQATYLREKSAVLNKVLKDKSALNLDWIWNGDGYNQNAALTVFRHFDSATVIQGLVGQPPKTAWLIDYPILERIHYLLVAGFDVYGNIVHQLSTRLYMDFLRMESEFNFLTLLPGETRSALRDYWYRGASDIVKDYVYGQHANLLAEPDIKYPENKSAKSYLYSQLQQSLSRILSDRYELDSAFTPKQHRRILSRLHEIQGNPASLLPELGFLTVIDKNQDDKIYTILRNSAHSHIATLLNEESNRMPEEDYITVMPGFVGAFPDALWRVEAASLADFVASITNLKNEDDYSRLMYRYGIRRSNNNFWQHSDRLHEAFRHYDPVEYGILDYSRIENR